MTDRSARLRQAIALQRAGRADEAGAICREVLSHCADDPDALHVLGVLALQRGAFDEAVDLIRRAIRSRPAFGEAYNNLGVALEARGQYVKAEWAYRRALNLNSRYAEAFNNLGNVLRKQGRPAEAAEAYRSAIRLRPQDPIPYSGLGAAYLELGYLNEAIRHYRHCSGLQADSPTSASDVLFWLLHVPDLDPQRLFEEHQSWSDRFERPLIRLHRPHDNDVDADRVLRVGYVSPDFREHTVARFIEPVLANHDPGGVCAICYSDVANPDVVTARLKGVAGAWRDTAGVSDQRLAELIRLDGIDILVDLTGHMGGNRLTVFARKPAPVQVTYMAYPHSTGLSTIDWRITDADCDPVGEKERHHALSDRRRSDGLGLLD